MHCRLSYLSSFYHNFVNQINTKKLPELIAVTAQPPINKIKDTTIIGGSIYKNETPKI